MSTSASTSVLFKPTGKTKISSSTFSYFRARNRLRVFHLVQEEFERSGLTQADLAARMGKGADRVCRLLGAPGNWTLDTVSDLLFAISGTEAKYELSCPFDKPKRDLTRPSWLLDALKAPSQVYDGEQNLLISKQETPIIAPQRSVDPLDKLRAA